MHKLKTTLLIFSTALITFIGTQIYNNYTSWGTLPEMPASIRIPNATQASKDAADGYLKFVLSKTDIETSEGLKQLKLLVAEPQWTFSNSSGELYMRSGQINNDEKSTWNWCIRVGNIRDFYTKALKEIQNQRQEGKREEATDNLVTLIKVPTRLFTGGDPELIKGLIATALASKVITTIDADISICENPKVRLALQELSEVATVQPGIEFESAGAPHVLGSYLPIDQSGSAIKTFLIRCFGNQQLISKAYKDNIAYNPVVAMENLKKSAFWHLAPVSNYLAQIALPDLRNTNRDTELVRERSSQLAKL